MLSAAATPLEDTPGQGEADVAAEGSARVGLRRPLRRAAWLQSGSAEIAVRCLDVGAGGIAVVAASNLGAETRCFVRFELPLRAEGVASLGLPCSVAHCIYSHRESGFIIGLQFENVGDAARKLLERYLAT